MIKSKRILYKLNSTSSYIGLLGIAFIFYGFIFVCFIFPISYSLHEITKKNYSDTVLVTEKRRTTNMGIGWTLKPFYLVVKNNAFKTRFYINENIFNKIKLNDKIIINGYKSFLGYSFNGIATKKTNKCVE